MTAADALDKHKKMSLMKLTDVSSYLGNLLASNQILMMDTEVFNEFHRNFIFQSFRNSSNLEILDMRHHSSFCIKFGVHLCFSILKYELEILALKKWVNITKPIEDKH